MRMRSALQGATVALAVALVLGGATAVPAQDRVYATGALPAPADLLETFPTTPRFRAYLPEAISMVDRMPSVGDQGRWGSCVSWAVGYAARSYYERASHGRQISRPENLVSPAWLHDLIRADPNDCERGAFIHKGLEQLETGAVSLASYPYSDQRCRTVSTHEAASVDAFRIKGWRQVDVDDLDQVKGQLALGHPVIFGAALNAEFMRERGREPWRADADEGAFAGNHAMTMVGYDDRTRLFTFINSWGTDWGDGGYGTMTYDTFLARVHDAYVIDPLAPPIRPDPDEPEPRPQPDIDVLTDLGFECAQVFVTTVAGKPTVRGFVSRPEDLEALKASHGREHEIAVEVRPWPQCEALLILTEGRIEAIGAEIDIDKTAYSDGDPFVFSIDMPNFSSHLHLSYFQADGSVVHLQQSAGDQLTTLLPGARLTLGDGQAGRPRFQVSGPFGQEMLLAITTRSPLFTRSRPQVEEERDFLSALRAATIAFEDEGEGRYYASRSVAITTMGDSP